MNFMKKGVSMTRISLKLTDAKPLTALYHPDIKMVSFYSKDDDKDFSIVLSLPDYNAFLNDIARVNIAIGKAIIKEEGL